MLQYIKRLAAILHKVYIKIEFKSIHKGLDRLEKKYKV